VEGLDRTIEISCNPNLVGGFGHLATVWFVFTIGWWGTLMFLLFTVGAFLIFNFNHQVEAAWVRFSEWWADMLKSNPKEEEEEEEEESKPIMAAAPAVVRNEVLTPPAETTIEVKTPIIEPEAPWEEKSVVFEDESEELLEEDVEEITEESEEEEFDEPEILEVSESVELETELPIMERIPSGGSTTIQVDEDFSVEVKESEEELDDEEIQRSVEALGPFDPGKAHPFIDTGGVLLASCGAGVQQARRQGLHGAGQQPIGQQGQGRHGFKPVIASARASTAFSRAVQSRVTWAMSAPSG
jgi:hypothetical protein